MAVINKTTSITEIITNKISVGGKPPKSIWKGSTEVKKVYKGSALIYEKGPVTYTLYRSSDTVGVASTNTSVTISISSYKGTSTAVGISASVVSGSGVTIGNITNSGSTYNIPVSFSANTSQTTEKTYKIRVTQNTSGQSADIIISHYTRTYYYTINKIGFRFSGSFPTPSGIECRCTNLNLDGTSKHEAWNGSQASTGNYGPMGGNCRSITRVGSFGTGYPESYIFWNTGDLGSPKVKNGSGWQFSFIYGATWSGTTTYSGNTWYMRVRENKNLSNTSIIIPETVSSMQWQTYTQPSGPMGWSGTFQKIDSDKSSYDLVVDINWSWSNSWNDYT